MASINYGAKEISVKVVYYGPGLSGKTTNLQIIHQKVPKENKSNMVSLATETDRTLFFDFLPLDLGKIKGFSTKFQLYTVPGQVYYNATRKLVLRGVDGVVFVADSSPTKIDENLESFQNLLDNLAEYGYQRESIPVIIQYNKRDLPNALSIEELEAAVNPYKYPYTEAIASKGKGVFETLKVVGKIVLDELNRKYSRPATSSSGIPMRPAPAAAMQQPARQPTIQHAPVTPPPQPVPPQRPIAAPTIQRPPMPSPVAQAPVRPQIIPVQPITNDDLFMSPQRPTFTSRPTQRIPAIDQNSVPPPVISEQPVQDFYDYNTVNLEPLQASTPAPRQAIPKPDPIPVAPERSVFENDYIQQEEPLPLPTESGKTDLDLEIERYQREIAQKQERMNKAPAPSYSSNDEFDLEGSSQAPIVVPSQNSFNRGQANPSEYDVYNLDGSNEIAPQEIAQAMPQRPPTDNQMYFTTVNTDKAKKKIKPQNPREIKDNKGFFSKMLGKKDPDE